MNTFSKAQKNTQIIGAQLAIWGPVILDIKLPVKAILKHAYLSPAQSQDPLMCANKAEDVTFQWLHSIGN
jgi:hypothetical protein